MASYNELNALIDAYINRNGVQAITGQILNGVLKAMVEQLGRGYTIMGAAIPATDPGTPDGPECYFASAPGTYTDFDGLQIVPGELALLCYTPTDGWTKATIYEGFQTVQATIDGNVGTPSVGVSYADGILSFDFRNMKGNPGQNGQDGAAAGFGTIDADITGGVGTPGVTVESSGPATAKNLQFHFTNLKGETGVTSVVATVDNTTGTPACTVSLVGQQLTLAFSGLKGAQGNTGSSVDYPFTIVNNLTTDDATQALSAAQGVVLDGKISQLQQEVTADISQLEHKLPMLGGYLVPLLRKVVYKDDDAESLINGINALLNTIELTSISAVYTQPGTIYVGQSLDDLKNDLVVTANYNDGTSVEVSDYELSGSLTAGTSSIVVTYQEETTTFNVTVTDAAHYKDGSIFPGLVSLRSAPSASNLSQAYTYNGVTYVFAASGSTTSPKRCSYYLFDLLLTAGKKYRFTVEFDGTLTSNQSILPSIGYYDESFRQAGVANVYQAADYSSHVSDPGWLTSTKVDSKTVQWEYTTPTGFVGARISMKLQSSGTDQNWPSSLNVKRLIIQEVTE